MTIKVLTITNLYPNCEQPRRGIFTEHRVCNLALSGQVDQRVLAPLPWFPKNVHWFKNYSDVARVPAQELRNDIRIHHPRYPMIPKVSMRVAPALLALGLIGPIRQLLKSGFHFDIIDSYYFYPDGVAAAILGRIFHEPVVITAYGSDIHVLANYRLPRRMIRWAAQNAAGITTVSKELKSRLVDLEIEEAKVRVILHGVDCSMFMPPTDRPALRERLGINGPTLMSVGNLIKLKGHDLAISALQELPGFVLLIAGDGEQDEALHAFARSKGVGERVRFLGLLNQDQLRDYYGAADALVHASEIEGIPNVLLESMACGTPVIATAVGGIPEIVSAPEAGILVPVRTSASLADAVRKLFDNYPNRDATRRYAEPYTWQDTTEKHLQMFAEIL